MKRLHWIYAAGLVIGTIGMGLPAQATDTHREGFYQFARKSAELYRGQLFTKTEMAQFVDEITRQMGTTSAKSAALLSALKNNPYDPQITAQTLQWLETECQTAGRTTKSCQQNLKSLKERLEKHQVMLTQVAETYEG